jgi:hypothetical protein
MLFCSFKMDKYFDYDYNQQIENVYHIICTLHLIILIICLNKINLKNRFKLKLKLYYFILSLIMIFLMWNKLN